MNTTDLKKQIAYLQAELAEAERAEAETVGLKQFGKADPRRPMSFETIELADKVWRMLEMLVAIRREPGCVPAVDGLRQYTLSVNYYGNLTIVGYLAIDYKLWGLMPCFSTREHAEAALAKYGQQYLAMANFFNGEG
jgi:hypothetical protein